MENFYKNKEALLNKPILAMNGAEFLELLQQVESKEVVEQPSVLSDYPKLPPFVTGIKGVAKVFGISSSTVSKMKAGGVLDEAILQNGKTVIFETYKLLEILRVSNRKTKFNIKNGKCYGNCK